MKFTDSAISSRHGVEGANSNRVIEALDRVNEPSKGVEGVSQICENFGLPRFSKCRESAVSLC